MVKKTGAAEKRLPFAVQNTYCIAQCENNNFFKGLFTETCNFFNGLFSKTCNFFKRLFQTSVNFSHSRKSRHEKLLPSGMERSVIFRSVV